MAYSELAVAVNALTTKSQQLFDAAQEILNNVPGGSNGANLHSIGIYSGQEYGIDGGAADMSEFIIAALADLKLKGGGTLICHSKVNGEPIKIDNAVNIEGNNINVIFDSPIEFGPLGYVRFNGRLAELYREGQIEAGKISANTYANTAGKMVCPMVAEVAAFFEVGDRITLRGQNDKNGAALQKQVTTIIAKEPAASGNGVNIICADEPDFTFQPFYPGSAWPPDATTGTTVIASIYSQMALDSTTRTDTVKVVNSAIFNIGDLCYISDSRTEADFMSPEPSNLLSQVNMEIYRIVGKDMNGTTNTLTFERELLREYLMAFKAGVTKMDPVFNSHIVANRKVSWPQVQSSRKVHSFAANYGHSCSIKLKDVQGKSGKLGASARIAYSYDCHIYDSSCHDAYRFESAEGYGLILYYSTMCSIKNCTVSGMRHNYLLQTCTSCDITDNISSDDYISGIDLHGARSINTRILNNRVGRSRNFAPGVTWGGGIRNGNTSHTLGDHGTIIEGNIIEGYRTDAKASAIDISPSSQGVIVRDNTIVDCWIGVHHYPVGSQIGVQQATDLLIVEGNTFTRCEMPCSFKNASNSVIKEVVFTNNKSIGNKRNFVFEGVPTVRAYGNEIIAPIQGDGTAYALEFIDVNEVSVYGNICGKTDRGILLNKVVKGNVVRNFCQDVRDNNFQIQTVLSPNVVLALNGNETGGGGSNPGGGGTVKSVNGISPDDEGNVSLDPFYGDSQIDFMANFLATQV